MTDLEPLGSGYESDVFALDSERVLRVYRGRRTDDVQRVAAFLRTLDRSAVPFALPDVLEIDDTGETTRTVERRMPGTSLERVLPTLAGDRRRAAIRRMTEAAAWIHAIPLGSEGFGEILAGPEAIRSGSWRGYLRDRMRSALDTLARRLATDVNGLDGVVARLEAGIDRLPEPGRPQLVHGDWFPGNVMVGDDLEVTGVVDFSVHTLAGDPALDLAGAVAFLEMGQPKLHAGDRKTATEVALRHTTPEVLGLYMAWAALYYGRFDPDRGRLYRWCVRTLRAWR